MRRQSKYTVYTYDASRNKEKTLHEKQTNKRIILVLKLNFKILLKNNQIIY